MTGRRGGLPPSGDRRLQTRIRGPQAGLRQERTRRTAQRGIPLSRKGEFDEDQVGIVVKFALIAVGLLVVSIVVALVIGVMQKTDADARCAAQVRAHSAAVRATGELKAPKIVCPTQRIALGESDDPKAAIAKEMKRCWDIWGQGKLDLFGAGAQKYCHVCSTITVPGGKPVEGLAQYLQSTQALGDGRAYSTYLVANKEKAGAYYADKDPPASAIPSMRTDKPIGIVFYYAKGQVRSEEIYNSIVGNPAANTAVGATAGAVGGVMIAVAVVGTGGAAIPVMLIAGAAGGAIGGGAGLATGVFGRAALDSMSVVVARPLDEKDITALGCTYAPVANG